KYLRGSRSASQDAARLDRAAQDQLCSADLLAVAQFRLADVDATALRGDHHAPVLRLDHLADLSLHGAERTHELLARVEELQLRAIERRPGARRRIGAADQVVDGVDMVRPVDLRLGLAEPAFVRGLPLVPPPFLVLSR